MDTPEPTAVPASRGKAPMIIIGVIIAVLVIGGVFFFKKADMDGNSDESSEHPVAMKTLTPTAAEVPSDNIYHTKTNATKGAYLTDFADMTLYSFDKDTPGVSNCTATCAATWKPYTSGATAQKEFPKNIAVLKRSDGTLQFSYKGMPLYYFSGDQAVGDIKGDGVKNLWHLVKP